MNEINDSLRPRTLTDFIGQEHLKSRLQPYITEAKVSRKPMAHVLLTSQAGCGKTTLAETIAHALGDPFSVIDLSRMSNRAFLGFMRRFEGGIVLVDEIHRAKSAAQENLLTLMEEAYVSTAYGGRIDVPWLTVVAATTEPHKIVGAVRDRFPLQLEYDPYSDEELTLIVQGMARALNVELDSEDCEALGKAAGGIPRAGRDLVRAWRALSFEGRASAEAARVLVGRELDGLTGHHLEYLKTLNRLDGQAGERVLSNVLRCHASTLNALESLLIARGLISLSPTGRVLTQAGEMRLRGDQPQTFRRQLV